MVSTLHWLIYFRYLHGLFNRLYLIYRIQTLTYLDDRSIQEDEKGEANVMYSQSTFDNLASGKNLWIKGLLQSSCCKFEYVLSAHHKFSLISFSNFFRNICFDLKLRKNLIEPIRFLFLFQLTKTEKYCWNSREKIGENMWWANHISCNDFSPFLEQWRTKILQKTPEGTLMF